jgi:hypothetical protein
LTDLALRIGNVVVKGTHRKRIVQIGSFRMRFRNELFEQLQIFARSTEPFGRNCLRDVSRWTAYSPQFEKTSER